MNTVNLRFNNGFEWVNDGNVTFRGYLFDNDGRFFAADEAIRLFHSIDGIPSLESKLLQTDGVFTLIIDLPQGTLIATDPIGGFPLLYTQTESGWQVSDDAAVFTTQKSGWSFNEDAQPEFLAAGFVLGSETLVKHIHRTQAGEILFLHHNEKKEQKPYYWFLPEYFTNNSKTRLKQELKDIFQNVATRLIDSLQEKTAVLPLSGGYDSRLIACMLKKAGYEKVICFTYGKTNKESEISKKVAEALGFKWIFVDYDDIEIQGLTVDPVFLNYCNYVGNISSMPYLQEYFAVKHLKEHRLIPEDSIFIPGHIGDNIAGSYVEKTIRTVGKHSRKSSKAIRKGYFNFLTLSSNQEKLIEFRLEKWFHCYDPPEYVIDNDYDSATEDWAMKERLSKFIFNSVGVFPFFGFQYRIPLFDGEFRSFFRILPYTFRKYKNLYDEVLLEHYFIPSGVHFPKEEVNETPLTLVFMKLKRVFRHLVPYSIRKKRLRKRDYICYHKFTGEMLRDLKAGQTHEPIRINSYNALICLWYSNLIKRNLTDRNFSD